MESLTAAVNNLNDLFLESKKYQRNIGTGIEEFIASVEVGKNI